MVTHLTLEDEVSPAKALFNVFLVLAFTLVFFMAISFLLFGAVHWYVFRDGGVHVHLFTHDDFAIWDNPLRMFLIYAQWWEALLHGLRVHELEPILLLPLLAPLLSVGALCFAFIKSSYSFNFWYVLNRHFANLKDVEKMGLTKGILLVLGRFQNYVLGVSRPANILCVGETGSGKTTSVGIPSILRADGMSILSVDNAGTLARHTSGHRAELGKIFYFNWDLPDDADKGIFYPKWNPLSISQLPAKGKQRDDYLKKIASYLASADEEQEEGNYWHWLCQNVMNTMLSFLAEKVSQAMANDYFLDRIIKKHTLKKEERETLLSYYVLMPRQYTGPVIEKLKHSGLLNAEEYVPIGSWDGIPDSWKGKDLCFGMLTDWLLYHYLASKGGGRGDWRHWLERLMVEGGVFGYGDQILRGLEQFLYLSRQQRQIVFVCMIKPLKSFINQIIREKTSVNDFNVPDFRGIRNEETGKNEPVTVYVVANTKSSKFVARMFMELVLEQGVIEGKAKGSFPLLVVLDDVGQMLRVRALPEAVAKGPSARTSFLLLCNSLSMVENTYSRDMLEELVTNSNYKIILADDNKKMSRQLKKLAIFATKSVQIALDGRRRFRHRKFYADANYFHRLAKDFETDRNLRVKTREYQVVLKEGYYHRPVLAHNIHYIKDAKFKVKAIKEASYGLAEEIVLRRNRQDTAVPTIDDVLCDIDLGIDDETELKQFMNMAYDEAKSKMPEETDINSVLASNISDKWQGESNGALAGSAEENRDAWWLGEKAFDVGDTPQEQNPFAKKQM